MDAVVHSYRHRFGLVTGDPRFEFTERRLAAQPSIAVPSITIDGADDGVMQAARHTSPCIPPGATSTVWLRTPATTCPQQALRAFAQAVLGLQSTRQTLR